MVAEAYDRDPDFFKLCRMLQAYRQSLAPNELDDRALSRQEGRPDANALIKPTISACAAVFGSPSWATP